MWYPSAVTSPVSNEPVTTELAREAIRAQGDTSFDAELNRLATVARNDAEKYCGIRIGTQTIVSSCDSFEDMARLSEAPVQSITSIQYVDPDGNTQTLATSVYELRADDLDVAVVLKHGQSWPSTRPGSRITLIAVVGYSLVPPAVLHAMIIGVASHFNQHEVVKVDNWTTVDALLINHRRNA